jgi:glutamate formiminotransferase/formiminotetrahydrofolate cyclodeaminase
MDSPVEEATVTDWLNALAAPTAAPAGGAAAAFAGALGAALVEMVAGLTGARERYASVHDLAAQIGEQGRRLRSDMLALAARDAAAFEGFGRALALPRGTPDERERRARARADAFCEGAVVQLDLLARLGEAAELGLEVAERGLAGALGDAATAVFLAGGAARSAWWAVQSNLREAGEHAKNTERLATASVLLERVEETERRVRLLLEERLR